MVQLFHPALDRTITVTAKQAQILQRSGWQPVEELQPVAERPLDETSTPDVGEPDPLPEED